MAATDTLRSAEARGWGSKNDLTNGVWLNRYCPGANRVTDIDSERWSHVLHNFRVFPRREATIEYKRPGESFTAGQRLMLRDRAGLWFRDEDKVQLRRKVFVVWYEGYLLAQPPAEMGYDGQLRPLTDCATPESLALEICGWLWPDILKAIPA